MERILIVNTDDSNLSKGQSYGIVEACRDGIVTSTTALVSGAAIDHAVQLNRDVPALAVGMHSVLTLGRPLTAIPGLAHDGLLGKWIWQVAEEDTLPLDEVSRELTTQYRCFIDLFGWEPTHLGSHHHVHVFPQIFPTVAGFAAEKGITLYIDRQTVFQAFDFLETLRTSQGFSGEFYGGAISKALFLQTLNTSAGRGESSLEVMCHPAFINDIIRRSAYCYPRLTELNVLTSSSLEYAITKRGYRLGSFLNVQFLSLRRLMRRIFLGGNRFYSSDT